MIDVSPGCQYIIIPFLNDAFQCFIVNRCQVICFFTTSPEREVSLGGAGGALGAGAAAAVGVAAGDGVAGALSPSEAATPRPRRAATASPASKRHLPRREGGPRTGPEASEPPSRPRAETPPSSTREEAGAGPPGGRCGPGTGRAATDRLERLLHARRTAGGRRATGPGAPPPGPGATPARERATPRAQGRGRGSPRRSLPSGTAAGRTAARRAAHEGIEVVRGRRGPARPLLGAHAGAGPPASQHHAVLLAPSSTAAMPKSARWARPSSSRRTFEGFNVAVHDAEAVQVLERLGHVPAQPDHLGRRGPAPARRVPAAHVAQRDGARPLAGAEAVDGDDARVLELPHEAGLAPQEGDALGGRVGGQDLRHHVLAPLGVAGEPRLPHPPAAQGADEGQPWRISSPGSGRSSGAGCPQGCTVSAGAMGTRLMSAGSGASVATMLSAARATGRTAPPPTP